MRVNSFDYLTSRLDQLSKDRGSQSSNTTSALCNVFNIMGSITFNEIYEGLVDYTNTNHMKSDDGFDRFHGCVGEGFHKYFRQIDMFEDYQRPDGEEIGGYLDMIAWHLIAGNKAFWTVFAELSWIHHELTKNPDLNVVRLIRDVRNDVEDYYEDQKKKD